MTVLTDSGIQNTHGWIQEVGHKVVSGEHRIIEGDWLQQYDEATFKAVTYDEKRVEYDAFWRGKDSLVSWVVSHCWTNSKRGEPVAELPSPVDVDTLCRRYGWTVAPVRTQPA